MESDLILIIVVLCWKGTGAKTKDSVSIVFGGDVDFSRVTRYNHHKRNCSYTDSLKRLERYFKSADFSMINFETTVAETTEVNPYTEVALSSDESVIPALKNVGINCVSLGNNHIQDFKEAGTIKTAELLRKYAVKYSGVIYGKDRYAKQVPLILKKNGLKIGILSYCDLDQCHRNWINRTAGPVLLKVANVISEVASLRKMDGCHIVILFMHWGQEYSSIINSGVTDIIRNLTKGGAHIDLIVGGHPHVKQKHFYMNQTLVAVSLGNLLFSAHGLANYNFNGNRSHEDYAFYERIWYKQTLVMKDGTQQGKLLIVKFNRNGIVKNETKYVNTRIFVTKQHCLATKKEDKERIRTICQQDDPECTGTPTCNYIECDTDDPLPSELPDSPKTST